MSVFGRVPVSGRYVRHKVVAALVTFVVLWVALKVSFPDGALEGIVRNLLRSTPDPEEAFAERTSGIAIETTGVVAGVLPDSLRAGEAVEPIQRVRFLSRSGHPLILLHDLARAPRVAVSVGDSVSVRGRYVWNPQGGLLLTSSAEDPGWIRALEAP